MNFCRADTFVTCLEPLLRCLDAIIKRDKVSADTGREAI